MDLLKASGGVYPPTPLSFPNLFPHFSAGKTLSPTTRLQLNGKVEGEKQGKAKRNRFEAGEWEQMGANEAEKYKEKAAPASGSCQGEGSIPGKGWKGNIPTRDRGRGASMDEEGDCSSLQQLPGGGKVFSQWNLRSQKPLVLHRQQCWFIPNPNSQPMLSMGHRNVLLRCQQQLGCFPLSRDTFPKWLFQENHETGKMRTQQSQRTG